MIRTMSKRVVIFGVFALWMFGMSGCVSQSEFDAKVTELKNKAERLAQAEKEASQLQKELDDAKSQAEESGQAVKDAKATINTLEQATANLKKPVPTFRSAPVVTES